MQLTTKYVTPIVQEVSSNYVEFDLIPENTKVEYIGHIIGGHVKVKLNDGREGIIHPGNTLELGD